MIELEREDDGRWIAEVPALPGVLAYGQSREEAVTRAEVLALRVLGVQGARLRATGRRARLPLVPFSNELVALLEAGLSLVEAIDALTEKERDTAIRSVFEGIRRRLYEGQSFSTALGEFPSCFSTLYVSTVRASEKSGAITEALRRFAAEAERWPSDAKDWQWCARFAYQVIERRGTGGGNFRLMYSRFLEEAGYQDDAGRARHAAENWTALADALPSPPPRHRRSWRTGKQCVPSVCAAARSRRD